MRKVWTINNRSGELVNAEPLMTGKWLVVDEHSGEIIGLCNGSKQTARDLFGMLEKSLPDNGDSWAIYERVGL